MKEFTIISPVDSLPLSCLVCEPAQGMEIKGIVQFSHGMCEHKERYLPFMEFLAANGYVCVINDHRGHGGSLKSLDDLGYIGKDGWSAMIDDTKAVTDWARKEYPDLKLTLLGHSMGSMVVRGFVKRYDNSIDALIVSGCPSDNPAKGMGKFISLVLGLVRGWHHRPALMQKMSFGSYNKAFKQSQYKSAWVCSDEKILVDYHNDPLCQFVFTADGFYNLMSLMQYCYSPKGWNVQNPNLKVHFISGEMDPCRGNDKAIGKAVQLMKDAGYANSDLKLFPGMRHEVLNETQKHTVWNYVLHTLA